MAPADPTGGSLINIGELAKPAVVLIEKISEAVGGIAKPWQIRRVASAESKADLIRAQTRIEISELEERALLRMVREEGARQENIENITSKSIPLLNADAKSSEVENDWLVNFFDKGRLISDTDMQQLWASMLAGEANKPGSFSKQTVELVSHFDKRDAELFTRFCSFVWMIGSPTPLIFDLNQPLSFDPAINFGSLHHLESIGLISIQAISNFARTTLSKSFLTFYYGKPIFLEIPDERHKLNVGHAMLSSAGEQLVGVCGSKPNLLFFQHIIQRWIDLNYCPYQPFGPPWQTQP
jgi:hypothetical protein